MVTMVTNIFKPCKIKGLWVSPKLNFFGDTGDTLFCKIKTKVPKPCINTGFLLIFVNFNKMEPLSPIW